ncbi:MAG: UDP-N-acetylmuramate dehydrogenase [Burkholderiales bacterium]|nr:UDP-N-acetylmuramate dehydrogenase [Burkholderiales bacterium]
MNMAEPVLANLRGRWLTDEPMSRHVSWRAGGRAQRAYVPADLDDLAAMVRVMPRAEAMLFVGLGSNLLVRDGGYRGTVVLTHGVLNDVRLEGHAIHAGAGVASPKVARFAATHQLTGAEFLAGIPGTIGGALAMNAGCYGAETWQFVREACVLGRDGVVRRRARDAYEIGYRRVALRELPDAGEEWFVAATFQFCAGRGDDARARIKSLLARRIATQPLNLPNAGSVFRNPPGDFAARLIDACGLKGRRRGGALISEKHANFIVNAGTAVAADIESLIDEAQARVLDRFGIVLEREVRIVGEVLA